MLKSSFGGSRMQKTLAIKLFIIAALCAIFAIGLNMFSAVIYERQSYADAVVAEIAEQHVYPQEVITPFIAIPTTVTPECLLDAVGKATKCAAPYSEVKTVFASQTQATQHLTVSTDTYKRGIYHATSYNGELKFSQSYLLTESSSNRTSQNLSKQDLPDTTNAAVDQKVSAPQQNVPHWNEAKLIIPVSDLRGVATLPTIMINKQTIKATYPQNPIIKGLAYVEVVLPEQVLSQLAMQNPVASPAQAQMSNSNAITTTQQKTTPIEIVIDLSLSGISNLNTVPTGQNFELAMRSNWRAPNFIGKALPNAKSFSANGFEANWQNQYLTIANNQRLSQCLGLPNNQCTVISSAPSDASDYLYADEVVVAEGDVSASSDSIFLNSFGVSFAEPNDVYLQTERTMKYALLLILVSFGTFFLFEIIKSSRIHPIQYLLVGCALLVFYVLLLPLAEQIAFWQAYTIAASACIGLIGWYTYYVLNSVKRAVIFTTILASLYAAFYGILTTEDMNLLLGAVFCFVLLTCVMIMTRKIDWYKIA